MKLMTHHWPYARKLASCYNPDTGLNRSCCVIFWPQVPDPGSVMSPVLPRARQRCHRFERLSIYVFSAMRVPVMAVHPHASQ